MNKNIYRISIFVKIVYYTKLRCERIVTLGVLKIFFINPLQIDIAIYVTLITSVIKMRNTK